MSRTGVFTNFQVQYFVNLQSDLTFMKSDVLQCGGIGCFTVKLSCSGRKNCEITGIKSKKYKL